MDHAAWDRVPIEAQSVAAPLSRAAVFLVMEAGEGDAALAGVRDTLGAVGDLVKNVAFRDLGGRLSCVVGIGAALWDRLSPGRRPADLHTFVPVQGPVHTAPATPGDLLFHLRAHRLDLCFELAQRLTERLAGVADVIDEVHGFRSFDERDLLGFVDGTENPEGAAADDAVLIGDDDPAFAQGSYVVIQKYVHDMAGWDALSTEEQERAMGRTKLSDLEFSDEDKPDNAHIALTVIEDENGEQRQIMRFNMPFGRVGAGEFGTYFIGYARHPDVIEQMLTNMFIGKPRGTYDRILDFSTAITGNLFFVPSADFLDDPPEAGVGAAAARESATVPEHDGDDSLRIGSLRWEPE
jgi:putative iron-dependent peroxidase